jgi:DNA repair protein RadA/Sms
MPKPTTKFVCQQCGFESAKWMGRCPDCGEWNTLVEAVIEPPKKASSKGGGFLVESVAPIPLPDVTAISVPRRSTGSDELDRVLGGGLTAGSLILLGGEPGVGKCVTGDTRILDPASGSLLPITEYTQGSPSVLALDETSYRLGRSQPSQFHDQGVKPVVKVTTRLGRVLRCTPDHPVFTPNGWHAVGDLTINSRIASPRALPYFGHEAMPDLHIKLIAYILSDGSATSQITVTNMLPDVKQDLKRIANAFGMTMRIYKKRGSRAKLYRFVVPLGTRASARDVLGAALRRLMTERGFTKSQWAEAAKVKPALLYFWLRGEAAPSHIELQRLASAAGVPYSDIAPDSRALADMVTPIARFLEGIGLRFKTASTKAVPECIFKLPRPQVALFLKTIFSCDGSVYVNRNNSTGVSYSTISLQLAADIQHLLLRFGFVAKLRTKSTLVNSKPYTAYELQLLGLANVKRFLSEIGIYGRDKAKAKIEQLTVPTLPSTHFDTIPTGATFWDEVNTISGGASFRALSRVAGVTIHPGRPDGPLTRMAVVALAAVFASDKLQRLAHGDIYWDTIARIEPDGEEQVYDLTVPNHANFVANDLVIHNSTLLLQVASSIARTGADALYVSAEESPQQIKLRAERMGIMEPRLYLQPATEVEAIVEAIETQRPALVVVDSIQTVATGSVSSSPGSVSQVRECALQLMRAAKRTHTPICLIGHVTKEGSVAGPRTLEHMVDVVLYLEGERFHTYRLARGVKNRFGATNEVGVFEMRGDGMIDVPNPSGLFLSESRGQSTGSAVVVSMEGTRPLLVETQALVTQTVFGAPRQTATGFDRNRLQMLLAVLIKRAGLGLGSQDVYVNVAGGFELSEPAVDLAVAVAIASNYLERRVQPDLALVGEVGLGGELRSVPRLAQRVREAAKLGFRKIIAPPARPGDESQKIEGIRTLYAPTIAAAIEMALEPPTKSPTE